MDARRSRRTKQLAHLADEGNWSDLESNAHRPEVQEQIRHAIKCGTIRVHPKSDGLIRIEPLRPFELAGDHTMTEPRCDVSA